MAATKRLDMKTALRAAGRVAPIDPLDSFDAVAARMVEIEQSGLVMIPLAQLRANPDQPRRTFEEAPLEELAASIREVGILQPILVRRVVENNQHSHYEIVAGERRWRAAQMVGLETVPVTIRELDDAVAIEASLTENLQRQDLTPLEEALIFRRMIDELGYSIRRLADRLAKGKGFVEDRLRLAGMDPALQEMVSGRPDTLTHAREIDKVTNPALRVELIKDTEAGKPLSEVRRKIRQQAAGPEAPDIPGSLTPPAPIGAAAAPPASLRDAARDLRLRLISAGLPTSISAASALTRELRALETVIQITLPKLESVVGPDDA